MNVELVLNVEHWVQLRLASVWFEEEVLGLVGDSEADAERRHPNPSRSCLCRSVAETTVEVAKKQEMSTRRRPVGHPTPSGFKFRQTPGDFDLALRFDSRRLGPSE